MKLSQNQIKEIKRLSLEGKKQFEISKILNIVPSRVDYWSNDEVRKKRINKSNEHFKNLTKEQRSNYYKSRKEYLKNYMRNRYQTDETFREKVKARQREYERRSYKKHE
jgi:hypothetical protein